MFRVLFVAFYGLTVLKSKLVLKPDLQVQQLPLVWSQHPGSEGV